MNATTGVCDLSCNMEKYAINMLIDNSMKNFIKEVIDMAQEYGLPFED